MLHTFLVCTGLSPTAAASRPVHAPPAATPRSIHVTMLSTRTRKEVAYTVLESDGSDVWRADDAVSAIRSGGVGVIPTDTGYDYAPPSCGVARRALLPSPRSQVLLCHSGVLEGGRQPHPQA